MPDLDSSQNTLAADDKTLAVPFSRETALETKGVALPAAVHANNGRLLRPREDKTTYMHIELDLSRLNAVHSHLWLAGLTRPARPLHRQELIGREIVITEQADLHLVWYKSRMFIKPLPSFLLHYDSWVDIVHRRDIYQYACGLLHSYTWLISRKSDLRIAHQIGLLSEEVTWERWTAFIDDFLEHVDGGYPQIVNPRYLYGELRLTRLNYIFRLLSVRQRSIRAFKAAFFQFPDWYTSFLNDNFGWLVVVFGYIAIVLNAMQVGLGTTRLGHNDLFQNVSYGFSVFAITMPVIVVGSVVAASLVATLYNVQATLRYVRDCECSFKELERAPPRDQP